jgi:copper chaperone CopZ
MPKADIRQMKQVNLRRRQPAGWWARQLWMVAIALIGLASCAPPVQKTTAPSVNLPSTGTTPSPVATLANMPTALPEPSATSTPPPATATVTSSSATPSQHLTTAAIKFIGDVQYPEVLEKMRQDIFYLKGVVDAQVGYNEVDVTYDPDQVTLKQIETVIEDHGYHVQK